MKQHFLKAVKNIVTMTHSSAKSSVKQKRQQKKNINMNIHEVKHV